MESTSSPAPRGGILSSPRAQRRLYWASGGVFAVGLIVFISVFWLRSTPGIQSPISTIPAQHAKAEVKAPPDPAAFKVARKFIETAVLRKNLDASYALVNPEIRGTMTRKQWDTGNIPVTPYPAGNAKTAAFTIVFSYKTQIEMIVDLVAAKGTHVRPHLPFYVGLKRVGDKPNGRWRVNYFTADWTPPIPSSQ